MKKEKNSQVWPIDVRYCVICGHAIKDEPIKDGYRNLHDVPFCFDFCQEVVE